MALLALYCYIGEELHLDGDEAFALACLAAAALGVEREGCRRKVELPRGLLRRHELSYLVVGFEVGCRIGAGGTAYGVLVDECDVGNAAYVASEALEVAGSVALVEESACYGAVTARRRS